MTRAVAALAVTALALSVALSPSAGAAPAAVADRALNRALERVVRAPGGPPGVISVVHRGGRTFVHWAGVADLDSKRRWRAFDHMRVASTSKAFSGAVALSLVRRGRLELDDTIGERLPGLPAACRRLRCARRCTTEAACPTSARAPAGGPTSAPTRWGASLRRN